MHVPNLTKRLAEAGLRYLGMAELSAPLIPPRLAGFTNSTAAEGEEWAASVENDAPDYQERVNHEWYMLSASQGLFNRADPKFLVAVSSLPEEESRFSWWAHVALASDWDFSGAGAEARVTGHGWGNPEFAMLSTDGNVIVQASRGQKWTDIVCLKNPQRIRSLRDTGAKLSTSTSVPEGTREAIRRWLDHTSSL
ncbi:hypothetical protein [Streptomyces griseofuscus]|uniref:hypothetical protein n=1 Tax=Streptomyces griseofuscus TaxID=146922 RepID=UPI001FD2DBC5|nr:hypothetical protein [Streptomyces griseofuscus]